MNGFESEHIGKDDELKSTCTGSCWLCEIHLTASMLDIQGKGQSHKTPDIKIQTFI